MGQPYLTKPVQQELKNTGRKFGKIQAEFQNETPKWHNLT